jgi:hypothetical protein
MIFFGCNTKGHQTPEEGNIHPAHVKKNSVNGDETSAKGKRMLNAGTILPIFPTSCTSWFNLPEFEPGWVGWKKDGQDGG